jgi:hypothetical protein
LKKVVKKNLSKILEKNHQKKLIAKNLLEKNLIENTKYPDDMARTLVSN